MSGQIKRVMFIMICLPLIVYKLWGHISDKNGENQNIKHQQRSFSVEAPSMVDWDERFSFVPNNVQDCAHLFGGIAEEVPANLNDVMKDYERQTAKIAKSMNRKVEGSTASFPSAFRAYLHLTNHTSVSTICETGFNMGFSTFGWLHVNPRAHVYSFDIGSHPYAKPMAQYLTERFPGRLNVIWGDSTETLPEFIKGHPEVKCDLIIIDGGHMTRVCKADFLNFAQLASPDNLVILDNYPQTSWGFLTKLGNVWEWAKRNSRVFEIFKCHVDAQPLDFGFSVGRYPVE